MMPVLGKLMASSLAKTQHRSHYFLNKYSGSKVTQVRTAFIFTWFAVQFQRNRTHSISYSLGFTITVCFQSTWQRLYYNWFMWTVLCFIVPIHRAWGFTKWLDEYENIVTMTKFELNYKCMGEFIAMSKTVLFFIIITIITIKIH